MIQIEDPHVPPGHSASWVDTDSTRTITVSRGQFAAAMEVSLVGLSPSDAQRWSCAPTATMQSSVSESAFAASALSVPADSPLHFSAGSRFSDRPYFCKTGALHFFAFIS